MPFVPFRKYFQEIAEKETRCIMFFDDPELTGDQFILLELFCDEPKCDCRRVILNVISENRKEIVAVISYGWESEKFYKNWYGYNDKEIIRQLRGSSINPFSKVTDITLKIFERLKETFEDGYYINRLINHYTLFRNHISELSAKDAINNGIKRNVPSRNELCYCGSGKKYKHCCLLNDSKNQY